MLMRKMLFLSFVDSFSPDFQSELQIFNKQWMNVRFLGVSLTQPVEQEGFIGNVIKGQVTLRRQSILQPIQGCLVAESVP